MAYTCENCGAKAHSSKSLCRPTKDEVDSKFCGISSEQVCTSKLTTMRYSCEDCGSVSANAENLCSPTRIG